MKLLFVAANNKAIFRKQLVKLSSPSRITNQSQNLRNTYTTGNILSDPQKTLIRSKAI